MLPFVERRVFMLAGLPDYVFVFECYSGGPAHNRPGNGMSNQVYDWSKTDGQILEYLLETTRKFTGVGLTFSLIQKHFGFDSYRLVVATFQAAMEQDKTLEPSYLAISTLRDGLLIDDDERLAVIDGLAQAGQWPDQLRDGIKSIAVISGLRWQIELGLTEAPTLESIAAARVRHEATLALNDVKQRANLAVSEASSVYDLDGTAAEILQAAQAAWRSC